MERSKDTISWEQWVNDRSVTEGVRDSRKRLLRDWAKANGRESPTQLLDDIFMDKITPYSSALAYVDSLRNNDQKPRTITQYRSALPGFFLSVLGEENFKRTVYDRLVPAGDDYVTTSKKAPTDTELVHLLNIANPRDRALLGVLCTGMRIGEVVTRRMSDLELQENGAYYRIKLGAGETKMRHKRYVYLTKETVQWINDYHAGIKSEWIFQGDVVRGRLKNVDHHLTKVAAWYALKELFEKGGLHDTETEIYSPHSMRTFSENYMIRCGLADKHTDAIIGHVGALKAKERYLDWNETGKEWYEKCALKMTWLAKTPEVVTRQENRITDLENKLKGMVQVVAAIAAMSNDEATRKLIDQLLVKNLGIIDAVEKQRILRELLGQPATKELPAQVEKP